MASMAVDLHNNSVHPPNNGSVPAVAQIIKSVMTYAVKAELDAFYITARKAANIRIISTKCSTNNPKLQSKSTTQRPKEESTAKSSQNKPRPQTYDSTGYVTQHAKNNFASTGDQEN